MHNLKTKAFWQILAILILLMATAHVPAQSLQSKNEKPKAILFGTWSEPERAASQPERQAFPPSRARYVNARSENVTPRFNVTPTSLERQAFELINAERRKQNLEPLIMDSAMLYLARQHSQEMSRLNFFDHKNNDGVTVDERARQAGIRWQGIGENIAFNQNVKNPVETAVKCWINSAAHRRTFLSSSWTKSGIGVAVGSDGKYYFTQVFRD